MTKKTFTFVLSMSGSGTHLLIDVFKRSPVHLLDHRLVEFWVVYVQALHDSNAVARSDLFPETPAWQAVEKFYARFDVDHKGTPLDRACAFALFAKMLAQAGDLLASAHNYELITPSPGPVLGIGDPEWDLARRDEARSLLEQAVVAAGYEYKVLILVRHPIDVYLSSVERTGHFVPQNIIMTSTQAFFRLVSQYRSNMSVVTLRYEDLCQGKADALSALARACGLPADSIDGATFASGEIGKYRRRPRAEIRAIAAALDLDLADLGYEIHLPVAWVREILMIRYSLQRYLGEIRALRALFTGDFRSPNAVFRRHRSIIGRIYWQLSLLIPARRRNYQKAYELIHGESMPVPKLERLAGRFLGLKFPKV